MYDQFYQLQGRPFQLTPDPHYYFESATHRKALSYLGYGLAQGEGFIVITGDIGAGKTTLVGHLMETIDPVRLTAVTIVSTQVEGDDMLRLAAQSFGLSVDGLTKAATLHQVQSFLHAQARAGRRSLLIVDEAQNLSVSAIEELRMLSNFQLGGQSLLQIFLLGQPEFRDLLKSPQLEQLRQRVIATHHLEPMMAHEVEPYIIHRLTVAGWVGNPVFTDEAFAALYAATGGVPRRLNALVSRVLLMGAIDQLRDIDADVVQAVVADLGLDVDVRPEAIAPSMLDSVSEAVEPELVEPEVTEPEASQPEWTAPEFAEPEPVLVAPFIAAPFMAEPFSAGPMVADAPEEDAEMVEAPAPVAAFDQPIVPAFEEAEVEAEAEITAEDDYVTEEFTAFDPVPEPEAEPDAEIVEDAMPIAAAMPAPVIDTVEIERLRSDMLGEIEALRAEISSLRAVQSHVPFAPTSGQTIDPEALKGCFTLIEERLASLEFRAEEQDTALRRVLTLLVDWVEQEDRMAASQASAAA